MTIYHTLKYGTTILKKTSNSPALDAEILLSFVLKKDRTFLFTYPEKKLSTAQWREYKELIARRKKHEPITYITHHKEFYGLDFYVDRRVLIPRPETEALIEKTIKYIKAKYKISRHSEVALGDRRIPPHILGDPSVGRYSDLLQDDFVICDLGTGSGCIAIALAKNLPNAKIYATDISKKAISVAKINAKKHKVLKRIKFIHSDLFAKIPARIKFDIIVANLPYLSIKKYQATTPDIKKYEPKLALYGGKNGTEIYQKLLGQVKQHLKPNGKIFLESNNHPFSYKKFS